MFEKYKVLSEAYEAMYKLADETCQKMVEAESEKDLIIYRAKHEAFLEAATAIHEQIMKTIKQAE